MQCSFMRYQTHEYHHFCHYFETSQCYSSSYHHIIFVFSLYTGIYRNGQALSRLSQRTLRRRLRGGRYCSQWRSVRWTCYGKFCRNRDHAFQHLDFHRRRKQIIFAINHALELTFNINHHQGIELVAGRDATNAKQAVIMLENATG